MSDRWLTLLGALGALLLLGMLLYSPQSSKSVSRPTLEDSGSNGYLGLRYWLEETGLDVRSHQLRWQNLQQDKQLPAAGNILVTTMPYRKNLRRPEVESIQHWLAQGNTLLILAALNDTPDWTMDTSLAASGDVIADLEALTELIFSAELDDENEEVTAGDVFESVEHNYRPLPEHPLMHGVDRLVAVSDWITSVWAPNLDGSDQFVLSMAYAEEHGVDALWELPRGEGRILVNASSSFFSNRMLGEADNARFFSNIMAWHLSPGSAVIFDDFHQGLSQLYDPEDFYADPRLRNTLWFILGFWLLYLVGGSARLAPLRKRLKVAHQADLVAATGSLMSRKLHDSEAGRAMVENWVLDLQRGGQLPAVGFVSPPWDLMQSMPLMDHSALRAIRDSYARLGRGEKVDLSALHNNILTLKRNIR